MNKTIKNLAIFGGVFLVGRAVWKGFQRKKEQAEIKQQEETKGAPVVPAAKVETPAPAANKTEEYKKKVIELQNAIGAKADGVIGSKTMAQLSKYGVKSPVNSLNIQNVIDSVSKQKKDVKAQAVATNSLSKFAEWLRNPKAKKDAIALDVVVFAPMLKKLGGGYIANPDKLAKKYTYKKGDKIDLRGWKYITSSKVGIIAADSAGKLYHFNAASISPIL